MSVRRRSKAYHRDIEGREGSRPFPALVAFILQFISLSCTGSLTVNVDPLPTRLSTRMPALVLLDDLPAHAQPQPGAAVPAFVRLLGRVERLEDQPQPVRRDAAAGVADADLDQTRLGVLADLDDAAARHAASPGGR